MGNELVTCLLLRPFGGRFWEIGIYKPKLAVASDKQANCKCPVDLGWGQEQVQ